MNHRGPDGEGYLVDDWFALGHKRLSVIDLKNSYQPFISSNKIKEDNFFPTTSPTSTKFPSILL